MTFEDIQYRESARSRRIRAGVRADAVVVSYPPGYRQEAMQWARQEWPQLQQMHEDVCRKASKRKRIEPLGRDSELRTLCFVARTMADASERGVRAYYRANEAGLSALDIHYNPGLDDANLEPRVTQALLYFLNREAKRVLPERLKCLAQQYGFSYHGVHIHNTHSRWGSCSSQKIINLSCHLLFLPEELVDLVLLHELCHTRQMNHGPLFWAELDQCTGGRARVLDRRLRQYEIPRWLK